MIFALGASAYAQGRGNGQAKTTAVSSPKPKAPAKPVKTETRAAKTTAKAETRAAKTETKAARKSGTIPATTTTVVTATTPTTHSVKNPKLEARLLTLLPAGTNIQDASQGFKNWGQFVAALHVSNNLSIPFADLKTAMTGMPLGTTVPATTPMSLGQAIQSFKGTTTTEPGTLSSTKIRTEVKKAEDAANLDLRRSRDRS